MDKFKDKYRIPSARLQNWDYAASGKYFITICTEDRRHFFGEIKNKEMILNEIRLFTNVEWEKIQEIRPDMNIRLGEFIVMPDHFHGIIIIGENEFNSNDGSIDAMNRVYTRKNKFGPQSKNIGSIIRGFKSAITSFAKKNNIEFGWQERFHDRVIRSHDEYERISEYIKNNPLNWKRNKFKIER